MLEGHYRNARAGVKPNYSCFAQRSIKVINKIYPFEFILNIMKIDPLLLKLTVWNFFKDFRQIRSYEQVMNNRTFFRNLRFSSLFKDFD